jgi:DNA-binding LacI/PurR family transcriptional regulator
MGSFRGISTSAKLESACTVLRHGDSERTGELAGSNEQERLRGYRQALRKTGLPVRDSLIWAGSFDRKEVARICHKGLFKPNGRPSVLFATDGVTGREALRSIYAAPLEDPPGRHAGGP